MDGVRLLQSKPTARKREYDGVTHSLSLTCWLLIHKMTRVEKLLVGLMILIIAGIVILYRQQAGIRKEQDRLERQQQRNPFYTPDK